MDQSSPVPVTANNDSLSLSSCNASSSCSNSNSTPSSTGSSACTCPLPIPVPLILNHQNDDNPNNNTDKNDKDVLIHNLEIYGWSPLQVVVRKDHNDNDHDFIFSCSSNDDWKSMIAELFPKEEEKNNNNQAAFEMNGLTFRTRESGAAGTDTIEPKQSWEWKRRRQQQSQSSQSSLTTTTPSCSSTSSNNIVQCRMENWTNLFHSVAVQLQTWLELPKTCLLVDNDNDDYDATTTNNTIDLLRAFYYDVVVVHDHNNKNTTTTLGSSPHTDWGSWTIIWQDDVPNCLQTYCPKCQAWKSVPTTTRITTTTDNANTTTIPLIVHVGDMTSLAIRHAFRNQKSSSSMSSSSSSLSSLLWPSPKHRVCSPTTEKRCSLVYFCYPPPTTSLNTIIQTLQTQWTLYNNHDNKNNNHKQQQQHHTEPNTSSFSCIPYEEYYLLQNQAVVSTNTTNTTNTTTTTTTTTTTSTTNNNNQRREQAQQQFEYIRTLSVDQVLQQKWNQVQRQ